MSLTQEDRTDICFRDPHYLERFGGVIPSAGNALEYLSLAPEFYTSSCINEQLKMQTRYNSLDRSALDISKMSGIEYYTWHSDVPKQVFHLLKQYKHSNTHATPMAAYYILQENIYQAPDLRGLLASRLRSCLHHLTAAYEEYSLHVRFHPAQGYIWESESIPEPTQEQPPPKRKKKAPSSKKVKPPTSDDDDDLHSVLETPPEKDPQLFNMQFISRVDTLIAQSAQKQHVVLVEKPPPPEMKPPNPTVRSKDSMSAKTPSGTKDSSEEASLSTLGTVASKKKRQKRELDLQSDVASFGGESTKSRKKKKTKKDKSMKSPVSSV